jgi:hypothetical protein
LRIPVMAIGYSSRRRSLIPVIAIMAGRQEQGGHGGSAARRRWRRHGMNLLPTLTGNAVAVDRKLFWRYKGKWQRAARIGDYKFLKILSVGALAPQATLSPAMSRRLRG